MSDTSDPQRRARPEQLPGGTNGSRERRQRSSSTRRPDRDRRSNSERTRRRIDVVQLIIIVFAVIGLGTTGVFAFRWLTGGEDDSAAPAARNSAASDEFVTGLEFTPNALRDAVEVHGVNCDGGWQDDGNGAQICAGERGYYAVIGEPLDRVIDGYVSGPLLEDNPDQYVIATVDAALIVPGDDMGWLYKVWDDCTDCYGWATGGGREIPVEFTANGLTTVVDEAVDCYWNYHGNAGYSSCAYSDHVKGTNWLVGVFDLEQEYGMNALEALHDSGSTSLLAEPTALQVYTSEAHRFITPPLMRACQVAGPCYVQIGDGEVREFNPATPEDVNEFFSARGSSS